MGCFNLNIALVVVAALLLSTTAIAQSPASSPTKSQPPRKAISPSPASSPATGNSPPEPSATSPAVSPSSISGPPSEAPGPASSAVLNRVSVAAIVIFVAAFIM